MARAAHRPPVPPPRCPFRTTPQEAGDWYRVHAFDPATGLYAPTRFNDTPRGNARFSPLLNPANGEVIPTIYAAATPRGAIAEIVLHDVPSPSTGHIHDWEQDKASTLHLSRIALAELELVNLTATGLRAAGLSVADLFAGEKPDYPRTRSWAAWIWRELPAAQGLLWMSVRDNANPVVMLFGDRIAPDQCTDTGDSRPIAHYETEVLKLLDDLGCGLAIP